MTEEAAFYKKERDKLKEALELFKVHMTFTADIIDRECLTSRLIYIKEQENFLNKIQEILTR